MDCIHIHIHHVGLVAGEADRLAASGSESIAAPLLALIGWIACPPETIEAQHALELDPLLVIGDGEFAAPASRSAAGAKPAGGESRNLPLAALKRRDRGIAESRFVKRGGTAGAVIAGLGFPLEQKIPGAAARPRA